MTHAHGHSHAHSHENTVPRAALISACCLVFLSLVLTSAVSLGFLEREAIPQLEREKAQVQAIASRDIRFDDREDGAVIISDVSDGSSIAVIGAETEGGGFIRGVMRGLARERRMQGIGSGPHFVLTAWADGSLSLTDTATGRMIELGAFGSDNRVTFAKLLPAGEAS
ncbi:photosynthetic complex assembly protein PuhC [Erythrobacter sp. HA6-11]